MMVDVPLALPHQPSSSRRSWQVLQLFQRHRTGVLQWLEQEGSGATGSSDGALTSQLLEALVQVVSNGPNAGQAELTLAEPTEPNAADATRAQLLFRHRHEAATIRLASHPHPSARRRVRRIWLGRFRQSQLSLAGVGPVTDDLHQSLE